MRPLLSSLLLASLSAGLFGACALPPPLSEASALLPDDDPAHRRRPPHHHGRRPPPPIHLGVAGMAGSVYPSDFGRRLAEEQGTEKPTTQQNAAYQATLPMMQIGVRNRWGTAAFTPLPIPGLWGTNLTLYLPAGFYVTGSTNLLAGEVVIQRRMLSGRYGGLGLGGFWRVEPQSSKPPSPSQADDPVRLQIVGARGAFVLGPPELRLYGYLSAGYAPEFDVPVLGLGAIVLP